MHNSVIKMRQELLETGVISELTYPEKIPAWHFCDNKKDADECAELVMRGIKKATSPSIWELKILEESIPNIGDLNIVTNWEGVAQCVIQTKKVETLRFRNITAKHAALEGEGDLTLEYWRKVHWEYYKRMLNGSAYTISEDIPIVFEQFEVIFPNL